MKARWQKSLIALLGAVLLSAAPSWAALPWGAVGNVTVANSEVSGATPTCTYSATLFVCIENMTANVTSLTLAGMTAGQYYTLIWMQDGTGSRTLTQTPITGTGAVLATGTTAANKYDVWLIQATSASAATFVQDFPNAPLFDVWNMTGATSSTSLSATATNTSIGAGVTSVPAPGMTANNSCLCQPQVVSGTGWTAGVTAVCVPATNAVTCGAANAGAGTPTAAVVTMNIRLLP